jgi:hypothetical protein
VQGWLLSTAPATQETCETSGVLKTTFASCTV